jgi:tetratricopeptide (TPR) repeat protein
MEFPNSFESYDPQVTDKIKVSASGVSGTKTFEYLLIPRSGGEFQIGPIRFSYFDPEAKRYKELVSEPLILVVSGEAEYGSSAPGQQKVETLGTDIRFIKEGRPDLTRKNSFFFRTALYWILVALPFLLCLAVIGGRKRIFGKSADLAHRRIRKANAMARRRLKLAKRMLDAQNTEKYYEEINKALIGYLTDKFSIQFADLTRDYVDSKLVELSVSEGIREAVKSVLEKCEFARFSPANNAETLSGLYQETFDLISEMERIVHIRSYKKLLSLIAMGFISTVSLLAQPDMIMTEANEAYRASSYQEAAKLYEDVRTAGSESFQLYYNLGNAYYKSGNFPKSILNYKRALRLRPGDEDALFNLKMAMVHIVDKKDVFLDAGWLSLYRKIERTFSIDGWARVSILLFTFMLLSLIAVYLGRSHLSKKIFFGLVFLFLANGLFAMLMAQAQYAAYRKPEAVILKQTVNIYSEPRDNSTILFMLHAGSAVDIGDRSAEWVRITFDEEKTGWMKIVDLEPVFSEK